MSGDELVLGIPRHRLPREGGWRGILYGNVSPVLEIVASEGTFRKRSECEDDPSWKQVIPYVVLRHGGEIFLMRRTRAGTDARLYDRYSVGIGGHVGVDDGGVGGGLVREWNEELATAWLPDFELVGVLNDDSDPVGAVHVGIVYSAEARGPVSVRETHKLQGEFVRPADIVRVHADLETWSQLTFDFVTQRSPGIRSETFGVLEQDG